MYQVIETDPLQDGRWDEFVKMHPYGWITHLSQWKTILESSFNHIKGHYFAIVNPDDEKFQALLPLYEVKSWLTGNRLVSIPFATLADPLVSSREEMSMLLETAVGLAERLKLPRITISTLQSSTLVQDDRFAHVKDYQLDYLPLEASLDEIKKGFHNTAVRQCINRAVKKGVELEIGKDESDLKGFYHLYVQTRKRLNLPSFPYSYIQNLWKNLYIPKMIELLMAKKDGELIAAVINFRFKDRVSGELEVWNREFRKLNPVHFLIWESIKRAHDDGYKIIDFGRTAFSNNNLSDFKKRWGTETLDLIDLCYFRNGKGDASVTPNSRKEQMVRTLSKFTPTIMQPLLGKICYRHLG